jgi:hypothetical protein
MLVADDTVLTGSRRRLCSFQCCLEQARWWLARISRAIPWQCGHYLPTYRCLGMSCFAFGGKTLVLTFQTIVQLLEAEDDQLTNNIRSSPILISAIRQLASSPPPSRPAGGRHEGGSDDEYEDDGLDADGEGEIANLARRILDLTEDGQGPESRFTNRSERDEQAGSQGSDTAALRASVHRALSGGH